MRIPPTGVGKTRHAEDERPQQCGHSQHQEDAPEQHQVVMLVQQKETHGNEQTEEDRVDHGLRFRLAKERNVHFLRLLLKVGRRTHFRNDLKSVVWETSRRRSTGNMQTKDKPVEGNVGTAQLVELGQKIETHTHLQGIEIEKGIQESIGTVFGRGRSR